MHARYYASTLGRFTGVDPLSGHVTDPQSLNEYTYVLNNPLNLTDPTGMAATTNEEVQTSYRQKEVGIYGDFDSAIQSDTTMDLWIAMEEDLARNARTAILLDGVDDPPLLSVEPQNQGPEDLIKSGTTEAASRLQIEPCSEFFGGTKNGLKALNSLKFIADPSMDESGRPQAELQANGIDVTINTHHVPPDGGGGVTPDGVAHLFLLVDPKKAANMLVLTLYGAEARGFVQVHETAHKAHKFGKSDNDAGKQNLMNGYRNNFKIWQACFGSAPTEPWHGQIPFMR